MVTPFLSASMNTKLLFEGDKEVAAEILPSLPKDQLNKLEGARFSSRSLEARELALRTTTDPDHAFDLALSL